jgi:Pyruvate/2-oxoacid:ferredoxin oxidoreductase gamma subunit
MSKAITKSFGIRISIELHDWLHYYRKSENLNRNQCICKLLTIAKNTVTAKPAAKPKKEEVKQPKSINIAWAGIFASIALLVFEAERTIRAILLNLNQ